MRKVKELDAFVLSNKEIREVLLDIGWPGLISEIKKGFLLGSQGENIVPPKVYIHTEVSDMRCMPAYLPGYNKRYCGVKIISAAPKNSKFGLQTVLGEYILRNAETQELLAVMQAEELTAFRTGAATGVATELLSRNDSKTLGIIGTGKQAYYQTKAVLTVRPDIKIVKVHDLDNKNASIYKERYKKEFEREVRIVPLKEVMDCDIVTTLTPATAPFITREHIKDGVHLNGVGADSKIKIEFEPDVLKNSRIFIDDVIQCINSGEIYRGLEKAIIKKEALILLGDVLDSKAKGRIREEDITFFKSTGVAFQDLITAILLFERLKPE
ncbi:MAG: ornithine cyclodeaminase family protein [Thermodesulfobacteriota bacterium]|nr:ornithine cyclodeaminase family protein [Thermodesulfobacteriota bacterium]